MNELIKCPNCELHFNTQGGLDRHLREIDEARKRFEPGMEFKNDPAPSFPTDADGNAYMVQGTLKDYIDDDKARKFYGPDFPHHRQ